MCDHPRKFFWVWDKAHDFMIGKNVALFTYFFKSKHKKNDYPPIPCSFFVFVQFLANPHSPPSKLTFRMAPIQVFFKIKPSFTTQSYSLITFLQSTGSYLNKFFTISSNNMFFKPMNIFAEKLSSVLNWDKVFGNGPSKICGRQSLKNLNGYGLLK